MDLNKIDRIRNMLVGKYGQVNVDTKFGGYSDYSEVVKGSRGIVLCYGNIRKSSETCEYYPVEIKIIEKGKREIDRLTSLFKKVAEIREAMKELYFAFEEDTLLDVEIAQDNYIIVSLNYEIF